MRQNEGWKNPGKAGRQARDKLFYERLSFSMAANSLRSISVDTLQAALTQAVQALVVEKKTCTLKISELKFLEVGQAELMQISLQLTLEKGRDIGDDSSF